MPSPDSRPRLAARAWYVALVLVTITLGLVVHWGGAFLGTAVQDFLGDSLWAAMISWMLGAVAPGTSLRARVAVALALCFGVELSQLLHTSALDAMRSTTAGQLVLGSGFDPRDLVAYTLGVLGAGFLERITEQATGGQMTEGPTTRAQWLRSSPVVVMLLLTAYNGVVEGINATHYADTMGMKVATATQLLYGFSAVAALMAVWLRRRLVFPILLVWGAAVLVTGTLAPVVYGGRPAAEGAIAGAVVALVVGLLLWAWPWHELRSAGERSQ